MKKPRYPNLCAEMARVGLSVEGLAKASGMNPGTLHDKFKFGDIRLSQCRRIQNVVNSRLSDAGMFQPVGLDYLFETDGEY